MLEIFLSLFLIPLFLSGVVLDENEKQSLYDKFQQTGYQIKQSRTEITRYNHQYFKSASYRNFKFNRTALAINMTFHLTVDLGRDIITQTYKFMSNEYRYFPLRMQVDLCDALKYDLLGVSGLRKCGNFTGCPFNKGIYHICNFINDESKYPPLMPAVEYQLQYQGMYRGTEIFIINGYGSVVWPTI